MMMVMLACYTVAIGESIIGKRGGCSVVCSSAVCVAAVADSFCGRCEGLYDAGNCWEFVQSAVVDDVHQQFVVLLWHWVSLAVLAGLDF